MSLPKVAIVGRPNVGKSSLMNMLSGRRVSIVDPTAGVTRDRVSYEMEIPPAERGGKPRYCELVDTGGYGVYSGDDELCVLTNDIEAQIAFAVQEAAVILFIVDAQTGVTPLDEQVAQLLRRKAGDMGRIVLVANKVDAESFAAGAMEATAFGFGEPMLISATTGLGKYKLLNLLADRLDYTADMAPTKSEMLLAIVGKRNAGKSTLVNAFAGSERVIASELAGTTRDSVDVRFDMDGRTFTAIDTAGVRKRKSLEDDIEYYSLHRALRSIRRADVVILLLDATVPVSAVDKKLSNEINEHFKPCIVVVNKWDLVPEAKQKEYVEYLHDALRGLDFTPTHFVSAKNKQGLTAVMKTALDLNQQAQQRITTGQLNAMIKGILEQRGPSSKLGTQAKVYYVTMPAVQPPTIAMFVNNPDLFDASYQRYMLNNIRKVAPFAQVPIKLLFRPRRQTDREVVAES
ncbi:MAG: ribosome biogenesis GTPase Der [Planctomycetes bacterium]|nr:ribosome biogenesis GTPase Der [Planctomycetota bacterium]